MDHGFKAEETIIDGYQSIHLWDKNRGLRAQVVPALGAQLVEFSLKRGEEEVPLIYGPCCLDNLKEDPIHYGNPILFPFPNRIANGTFSFAGVKVRLPINEVDNNCAIHGLVFDKPWHLEDYGADGLSSWVTCKISSEEFDDLKSIFPFHFEVKVTYQLKNGRMQIYLWAKNVSEQIMPMGFGLHPWFNLPLSSHGEREKCILKAPFTRVWELDRMCPTGNIVQPDVARDLSGGIRLEKEAFDDVYTHLEVKGWWEASYVDPISKLEITVGADSTFRELVIYAPLDKNVLCIEPYTCVTNAFNLQNQGIDAGTILLKPNETWSGEVHYTPKDLMTD